LTPLTAGCRGASMDDVRRVVNKQVVAQIKDAGLAEEKQRLIVQAANELFSKKGYHKTTMREIAGACGLNLASLYKYIPSKGDILYLFYVNLNKEWSHIYKHLCESEEEHPVEQIKNYLRATQEIIYKLKDEIRTMYTESRHLEKEALQAVLATENRNTQAVERVIRRGVEMGCFKTKDTYLAANIIQYLSVITTLRGWNFMDRYTFRHYVELLIDFVMSALGVPEDER